MNRNLKKVLALALTAMMLLSACGKTEETKAPESNQANNQTSNETAEAAPAAPAAPEANAPEYESITDLVLSGSAPNTFNILNTETSTDRVMLINLVEGLCDNNEKGQLIPAVATDWESSDNGKTWTFKLRNNAKWVDVNGKEKAAVTSADWATGMEWVLNFHKNSSFNSATLVDMIDGAAEYLEYTKGLDASEAWLWAGKKAPSLERWLASIFQMNIPSFTPVPERFLTLQVSPPPAACIRWHRA